MHFRSQRKSAQDVSLSDTIESAGEGAALSLMDVISDDSDLLEEVCCREAVKNLRLALGSQLTEQERQVIIHRYGLNGAAPKRQREVAQLCQISRSYVSRIEKRAIEKLRKALERN